MLGLGKVESNKMATKVFKHFIKHSDPDTLDISYNCFDVNRANEVLFMLC